MCCCDVYSGSEGILYYALSLPPFKYIGTYLSGTPGGLRLLCVLLIFYIRVFFESDELWQHEEPAERFSATIN